LVRGTWDVISDNGTVERVRPEDIRQCGLLTVEGELDDISGSGQTKAALKLCAGIPSHDKSHYEVKGAGHYGIFSGRRWREMVYPQVKEFISNHQSRVKNKRASPPTVKTTAIKRKASTASTR